MLQRLFNRWVNSHISPSNLMLGWLAVWLLTNYAMVAMLVKHALGLDQNVTGDKDVETEMTSVLKCPKLSMDSRRCF